MKHIILEASQLSIGYANRKKKHVICEGLDFKISEGNLVGLIGANGVGKSTLLRTLANMQPTLGGEISIQGKSISSFHPIELATQLSIVLTEPPASKILSVLEFVSLGRQPHTNWMGQLTEVDTCMIHQAMEQTDTAILSHKKCYELSDGQLQRAAIARALAQDTPLILLDEPTTHLDLFHQATVLKLLKRLALETNKTILFSTHEIDLAIQLADQLMVMTPNQLAIDTPERLIQKGDFDTLFPKETVYFDKETRRFTIKN